MVRRPRSRPPRSGWPPARATAVRRAGRSMATGVVSNQSPWSARRLLASRTGGLTRASASRCRLRTAKLPARRSPLPGRVRWKSGSPVRAAAIAEQSRVRRRRRDGTRARRPAVRVSALGAAGRCRRTGVSPPVDVGRRSAATSLQSGGRPEMWVVAVQLISRVRDRDGIQGPGEPQGHHAPGDVGVAVQPHDLAGRRTAGSTGSARWTAARSTPRRHGGRPPRAPTTLLVAARCEVHRVMRHPLGTLGDAVTSTERPASIRHRGASVAVAMAIRTSPSTSSPPGRARCSARRSTARSPP